MGDMEKKPVCHTELKTAQINRYILQRQLLTELPIVITLTDEPRRKKMPLWTCAPN